MCRGTPRSLGVLSKSGKSFPFLSKLMDSTQRSRKLRTLNVFSYFPWNSSTLPSNLTRLRNCFTLSPTRFPLFCTLSVARAFQFVPRSASLCQPLGFYHGRVNNHRSGWYCILRGMWGGRNWHCPCCQTHLAGAVKGKKDCLRWLICIFSEHKLGRR